MVQLIENGFGFERLVMNNHEHKSRNANNFPRFDAFESRGGGGQASSGAWSGDLGAPEDPLDKLRAFFTTKIEHSYLST